MGKNVQIVGDDLFLGPQKLKKHLSFLLMVVRRVGEFFLFQNDLSKDVSSG